MRPCDTCGKPTVDSMSRCNHSDKIADLEARLEAAERERDEALAEVRRLRPYERRENDLIDMRNRCEHVPVPSGYGHVCSVCGLEL